MLDLNSIEMKSGQAARRGLFGATRTGVAVSVAAVLALVACGGSDDNDAPAATPVATNPDGTPTGTVPAGTPTTPAAPAAPGSTTPATPAPGAATTPTAPTNGAWTADAASTSATQAVYYYDANANGVRDGIERFVVQNLANGHYYELATGAAAITWEAAQANAAAAGGHLFVGEGGTAEIQFVRSAFNVDTDVGKTGLPVTTDQPALGAWIGLRNPTSSSATPNTGWTWIATTPGGAETPFTEASDGWANWIVHPATPTVPAGSREPNGSPYAAMTGGNTLPGGETQCVFNMSNSSDPAFAVHKYLIEYENAAAIVATPPAI